MGNQPYVPKSSRTGRFSTGTNYKGEPYTPYMESILAGNPLIHAAMMRALFD